MFRNTIAQALQLGVTTVFSFLLAPIMLSQLGLTLFGVWAVVGAIVTYAGILDAGITRALARFVALHEARGERELVRQCVGLGLIATTVVSLLLVPLAWFGAPLLHAAIGHITVEQTRSILLASSAVFVLQGYAAVLVALPHGLQRMMAPNVAMMIGSTVNFAVSVAVLFTTDSLVTYAWANAAAELVTIPLVLIAVRRIWPERMAALPSRALAKEVLGFSVRSQIGWLADLVNMQTDRLVIGLIVNVEAAGAYQLGSSVAMGVRSFGVITVSAIIPAATSQIVKDGASAVRALFRRYAPLTLTLSLLLFTFGALAAPFVMEAWLGEHPPDAVPVLVVLCLAYALNVATGVPTTVSIAAGQPGFVSANAIATAVANLVLTVALAPFLGLWGVVAGTVLSVVGLSVVLIARFLRRWGMTAADARAAFARPTAIALGLALPLVPVVVLAEPLATSRWSAIALLAGIGLLYALPYWLLAARCALLPDKLMPPWRRSTAPA